MGIWMFVEIEQVQFKERVNRVKSYTVYSHFSFGVGIRKRWKRVKEREQDASVDIKPKESSKTPKTTSLILKKNPELCSELGSPESTRD